MKFSSSEGGSRVGFKWGIVRSVEGIASVAAAIGQQERALRLAGGVSALGESFGLPLSGAAQIDLDQMRAPARLALDIARAEAIWMEGRGLTIEQIVAEAMEVE